MSDTTLKGTGVEVKRGDRVSTFWQVFDAKTGLPLDLTGYTVTLLAQNANYPGPPIPLAISSSNLEQGIVEHITTGDLLVADYNVELVLENVQEQVTAPTCGFASLRICSRID